MEHTFATENSRVLSVQAEHQPDAQLVQTFQCLRVIRVFVLLQQRIIENPYQLTSLEGDFHFLFDMLLASVHQEVQAVKLLFQIGKEKNLRLVIGAAHIVDMKLLEVADYNPTRLLRLGQIAAVTSPLLEGGQHGPVRLALPLFKVNFYALLLDQDAGCWQIAVNVFRGGGPITVINFYPFFKFDCGCGLFNTAHILKQRHPKPLCLLLLITPAFPVGRKFGGGTTPFCVGHMAYPFSISP